MLRCPECTLSAAAKWPHLKAPSFSLDQMAGWPSLEGASSCKQAAHPHTAVPRNDEVTGDRISSGFQRHRHSLFGLIGTFKSEVRPLGPPPLPPSILLS